MSAEQLLADLRSLGVALVPEGNSITFDAPEGVMTHERLAALRAHKAEIIRLLATEVVVRAPFPTTGVGCPIAGAPRQEGHTCDEVLPHDAVRLLLAWGADHGYPPLPLKPGVSSAAGETRWLAFVSWAPRDLLALAVAQIQREPTRGCVILGCRSARGESDKVYCPEHGLRSETNQLEAPDLVAERSSLGSDRLSRASGATLDHCTSLEPVEAERTHLIDAQDLPDGWVDEVIEPLDETGENNNLPPAVDSYHQILHDGSTRQTVNHGPIPTADGGIEIAQDAVSRTLSPSLRGLIATLRDRDTPLYVDGQQRLHYISPLHEPDDPICTAIIQHRSMLIELFTYAPGGRCSADGCYRLRTEDRTTCPDHAQADE